MNTTFDKFERSEWNKIEKRYDNPVTNTVLDVIYDLGNNYKNIQKHIESNLIVSGDMVYIELRKELVKRGILPDKKIKLKVKRTGGKKNRKKKGMTKEEIIMKNKMEKTLSSFKNTLNSIYNNNKLNTSYGFKSNYAEIRLVTLILAIKYHIDNNTDESEKYELYVGVGKTLCNIHIIKNISDITVSDLRYMLDILKENINFRYEIMFQKYPKLCITTKYDIIFSTMSIKPYGSQKELMKILLDNNSGFIIYKAMIGSGKTTLSVAISNYCSKIRSVQKAISSKKVERLTQVLFACSVEPVRLDVCRMAYNKNIPFGIGVMIDDEIKIINNFNCKDKEDRILIVADLETTLRLLNKSNNYILFLDEPTVGADQPNHPITNTVCQILKIAPKCTILSSATMPELCEITSITDHYKSRYSKSDIHMVYSRESIIGCRIIDYYGNDIVPFANCKTCNELKNIIHYINTKPFVGRLLPPPILYKLNDSICGYYPELSVDIDKYFENISKLSQNEIQKIIVELLDRIASTDDDTVKSICSEFLANKTEIEYDISKIFTDHAYKFAGPCLIATENPYEFVVNNSKDLLSDINISNIITEYTTGLRKYKSLLEKANIIKDVDEKTKRIANLENIKNNMLLNFPKECRVNTKFHLQRYAPNINPSDINIQSMLIIESLPTDLDIPDIVMSALYAGIGIYCPSNNILGKRYTELVLELASDGLLAFLVSDDTISYGANYPFSHVMTDKTISSKHSINSIFQLAGRAGRVGESWSAYVHVDDIVKDRIINYIEGKENTGSSEEGKNITNCFNKILEADKISTHEKNIDNNNNNQPKVQILVNGKIRKVSTTKISMIEEEKEVINFKNTSKNVYIPPNKRYNKTNNKGYTGFVNEKKPPVGKTTSGANRGYNGNPNGNADRTTNWRNNNNNNNSNRY